MKIHRHISDDDFEEYLEEKCGEDHQKHPDRYVSLIRDLKEQLLGHRDLRDTLLEYVEDMYEEMTDRDIRTMVEDRLCAHCYNLCQLCGCPSSDLTVTNFSERDSQNPGKIVINDEKW